MAARVDGKVVKAPGTLVVSTYAPCPDITKVVTPDLKGPSLGVKGVLLHVHLSGNKSRLGGSALAQCLKQLGDSTPDVDQPHFLSNAFVATQKLVKGDNILAGHDISDGGLVTCLLEMSFGGTSGLNVDICHKKGSAVEVLFSEEVGWVLEAHPKHAEEVQVTFQAHGVPCSRIGTSVGYCLDSLVTISVNGSEVLKDSVLSLYKTWEETSYRLECLQANPECAKQEFDRLGERKVPQYKLTFTPEATVPRPHTQSAACVAVIREEGSNGDREMAASLHMAGFDVFDVTMQDLLDEVVTVDSFQGIVFPGGFSYADVLGSAKGWAASLLLHPSLRTQFQSFAARPNTFSLGVCNGCQLVSLLGWVGVNTNGNSASDEVKMPDIMLDHNVSERFECRFSTVRIDKSPSIMLEGMEGSVMGVWVAHGEGRFTFRNEEVFSQLQSKNCFAIKYVDDVGNPTEVYPMNPNGSVGGLAGVCSLDGRHLAMMPHPERCTQLWQWPWLPVGWKDRHTVSPWLRLFQNARAWVSRQSH